VKAEARQNRARVDALQGSKDPLLSKKATKKTYKTGAKKDENGPFCREAVRKGLEEKVQKKTPRRGQEKTRNSGAFVGGTAAKIDRGRGQPLPTVPTNQEGKPRPKTKRRKKRTS